jgi:8-oxo-dGTP pyrophosphatase MutT (NUDIX family)
MTGPGATHHDGDGWVECAMGHRHWGTFGAAGLLLHRGGADGETQILLQHRAEWSHHGGTWGLLGGARHRDEVRVATALREAAEEAGLQADAALVSGLYDDDHGGWCYSTVIAHEVGDVVAQPTSPETVEVRWWPVSSLPVLPLHPGFAETWPVVRDALQPLTVVVDAANVVGSRPDGWWKDRAGAARRLIADVSAVCSAGIADDAVPQTLARPRLQRWWPVAIVVLEGVARSAAEPEDGDPAGGAVHVVAAPGAGDDAIVAAVAAAGEGPIVVVTADRELRGRCERLGAVAAGPSWLWGLVDAARSTPD